jgi:hypothetical protein
VAAVAATSTCRCPLLLTRMSSEESNALGKYYLGHDSAEVSRYVTVVTSIDQI